jgi:hypothetical protein
VDGGAAEIRYTAVTNTSFVRLAAMTDVFDIHEVRLIIDDVDHAIVSHAETPPTAPLSTKWDRLLRTWILAERDDLRLDGICDRGMKS